MELRDEVMAILQEWDSDCIDITQARDQILAILKQPQPQVMSYEEIRNVLAELLPLNAHSYILRIAATLSGKIASPHNELDLATIEELNKEIERLRRELLEAKKNWGKYQALYEIDNSHSPKELPEVPEEMGEFTQFWCKGYDPTMKTMEKMWDTINALIRRAKSEEK